MSILDQALAVDSKEEPTSDIEKPAGILKNRQKPPQPPKQSSQEQFTDLGLTKNT